MSKSGQRARAPRPRQATVSPIRQGRSNAGGGKVCIAYIHPGQVSAYFTESLLATVLRDGGRRINNILQEWSSANVSAARNRLTQIFCDEKTESEWLLWVDSDMRWDADAIDRLIDSADPVERPVMGGLCFGRNPDGLFATLYQVVEGVTGLTMVRMPEYPADSVVRCSATGAAFLLIHRSVIEAMNERKFNVAFPFFQETELAGMPCGEDITFCLRAGLLGHKTHVDTRVKIGHHKTHLLTEDLFIGQVRAERGEVVS